MAAALLGLLQKVSYVDIWTRLYTYLDDKLHILRINTSRALAHLFLL